MVTGAARSMNRGEIRWYPFAKPDKKRPVLLLSRDFTLQYMHSVIVVPLTTRYRSIPTQVPLGPEDGVPRQCVIALDNIQTVEIAKLGPLITRLSPDRMAEVRTALLFATGFPPDD